VTGKFFNKLLIVLFKKVW